MSNAIASNAFVIPQRHLSGGNPETPTKGGSMRKRNNLIQIWLSDDELNKLSTQAAKCGLSRAAFLRQLICGFQPKELPPPDFYPMMRQLYYCGNNLNQIARKAHALGVIDVQKYDNAIALILKIAEDLNRAILEPNQIYENRHGGG